jgi:hypothetical protein
MVVEGESRSSGRPRPRRTIQQRAGLFAEEINATEAARSSRMGRVLMASVHDRRWMGRGRRDHGVAELSRMVARRRLLLSKWLCRDRLVCEAERCGSPGLNYEGVSSLSSGYRELFAGLLRGRLVPWCMALMCRARCIGYANGRSQRGHFSRCFGGIRLGRRDRILSVARPLAATRL